MIPRFLFALLLLYAHSAAMAALGGTPSSLSNDTRRSDQTAKRLTSVERMQFSTYRVTRTLQENGTLVSEFSESNGIVFAVSWQGPILPDMKALLGPYFDTFMTPTEGALRTRSLGSPMVLKTDALVIQSLGRMRGFKGYAYVPSLVPANVLIADLLQ